MTPSGDEPPSVEGIGRKEISMPITMNHNTKSRKSQWRALIVRAIEDACILLMLGVGIWLACTVLGAAFRLLGVD